MSRPILTIAYHTWLEALRNRLAWLALLALFGGLGIAALLQQAAVTETQQLQAAVLAALFRFGAVFVLVSFIITSMVRENNDKALELLLAMPLPRASYLLGKLAGFGACAAALALVASVPLHLFAPPLQVLAWALSLACELAIMAALSLFCVVTLTQILPALAAALAFYVLTRSITALQLIADGPLSDASLSQQVINHALAAIAFVLPRMDQFTRTEWLLYSTATVGEVLALAGQTAIYFCLLLAAALFDFYRRNL